MKALLAALLVLAAPAVAQVREDEAHRTDRLLTQDLNSRSPTGYAANRYAAHPSADATDRGGDDYARAQADYRRRLAEWRRRVAACENGYYDACQR